MTDQTAAPPAAVPEILSLDRGDLRHALRQGWRDFLEFPTYGAFFATVYFAGGWLLFLAFTIKGQVWWTLPAAAGFPILGPFVACGFYEISRRREAGEPVLLREVLGAVFRQKDRQIPSMAAVIVVFFLFWNFLSHMIFALFLGKATMTNVSSSLDIFLTAEGMMMLAFGTAVGAVFADRGQPADALGAGGGFRHRHADLDGAGAAEPGGDAGMGGVHRHLPVRGHGALVLWPDDRAAGVGPCLMASLSPGAGVELKRAPEGALP